jgi:PAS domain S-box-containing protein
MGDTEAEALRRAKSDLEQAQRVAKVGSWTWHVQTGALEWTDEMLRIFGLSRESFSGLLDQVVASAIHPDDRDRVEASNRSVAEKAEPVPLEYRVVWPDGTVRVVWAESGALELDEQGRPAILRGIVQDITERKHAEVEIRTLNAELEERVRRRTAELEASNAELEAFAYSVSHDLRAPLRAIDGFSHALQEEYGAGLDEEAQAHLERIRFGVGRMSLLIDDLLQLSRVTRARIREDTVNLGAIASEVIEGFRQAAPGRAVQVRIGDELSARGDPTLLGAALENLLGNAWKFTQGCAPARIEIGRQDQDGETVYYVRDNGAGFDMKYAGKLFGAFQRLHSSQEFEGTGIGLATVQRIVRRHGGRVWAEGEVGQGATFYFTLGR